MALLYNKIDKKLLQKNILKETIHRKNVSFYKYINISNTHKFRDSLYKALYPLNIFGRIYVAKEGINAQISIPENKLELFKKALNNFSQISNVFLNFSLDSSSPSFIKLIIKVKDKIVADGLDEKNFLINSNENHYIHPNDFNKVLKDDDFVVVDVRNSYENKIGFFLNAILLKEKVVFRECFNSIKKKLEKYKKNKKIAIYCTGGIRCEKVNVYLKNNGFKNIYQLQGGITHYLYNIHNNNGLENLFIGKNFTFDERLGEKPNISNNQVISNCDMCKKPCDEYTNCYNNFCHILFLQCSNCKKEYNGCCSKRCQEILDMPLEEKKKMYSGGKLKNFSKTI